MTTRSSVASLIGLALLCASARAEDCPPGYNREGDRCYKQQETIDFAGAQIEGQIRAPMGIYSEALRPTKWDCDANDYINGKITLEQFKECLGKNQSRCPEGTISTEDGCVPLPGPNGIEQEDPNKPAEETAALCKHLREEFDQTSSCPRSFRDIGLLKKIVRKAKASGLPAVDVSPLIATPDRSSPAHAPRSCGWRDDMGSRGWVDASFHCQEDGTCFRQHSPDLPMDCVTLQHSAVWPYVWIDGPYCNERALWEGLDHGWSYRRSKNSLIGFTVLVPLGCGIYIEVRQINNPSSEEYYHGLIFAPTDYRRNLAKRTGISPEVMNAWKGLLNSTEGTFLLNDSERERLTRMTGQGD